MIARKWRPQSFLELVGQNHVAQTLLNALKSGRLPHALLFTGPRGTGKTSSARILAKSLRCPNAVDFTPCNNCSECHDIANGRSFDVIELDGASNNGVDAIRELQESVRSMPSSGQHKLYIIDEVHMLSISAFNALLKTLEEPPSHVIFVLATTEVQKLPVTILSRCQRFEFHRIAVRQVAEHLKHICESEGIEADEESLWAIARQGGGSMRDSQSLLDQVITYTGGDLQQDKVIEVLGLSDRALLLDTASALVRRDSVAMLEVISRFFQTGHDPKVFTEDLLEELRHLLLIKLNPDQASEVVDLPESEIEILAEMGIGLSEEDIHMLFDMALKGAGDITRASDPRLVLEMLLLRMVAAPRVESLAQLLKGGVVATTAAAPKAAAPIAKKKVEIRPVVKSQTPKVSQPTPPAKPNPPQQKQPAVFDASKSLEENWCAVVQALKIPDPLMAAQLENTHLLALEDGQILLGLSQNLQFLYDQIASKEFTAKLAGHLKTVWKKELEVKVQLGIQAPSLSPKEAAEAKKEEERKKTWQTVENHPLVKAAKENLNVRIEAIKETK